MSSTARSNRNLGRPDQQQSGRTNLPRLDVTAATSSRRFPGSCYRHPRPEFGISASYTVNHIDSNIDVIVPAGTSGAQIDAVFAWGIATPQQQIGRWSAQPFKRVSLYANRRIDNDNGLGDLTSTRARGMVASYPINYHDPEARTAFRQTRNVDRDRLPVLFVRGASGYLGLCTSSIRRSERHSPLPNTSLRNHWSGPDAVK